MQGPKIPWRPGRIDGFAAQVTPDGRLPDASQGSDHLRNVRLFLLFCSTFRQLTRLSQIFYRMGYVLHLPSSGTPGLTILS